MRLRNSADYRTLVWVAMAAALVVLQYGDPRTVFYGPALQLLLGHCLRRHRA